MAMLQLRQGVVVSVVVFLCVIASTQSGLHSSADTSSDATLTENPIPLQCTDAEQLDGVRVYDLIEKSYSRLSYSPKDPSHFAIPTLNLRKIFPVNRPPSNLKRSSIQRIGTSHYALTDFCVSPESGVLLYGQETNGKSSLEICDEFGCFDWPVTFRKSPPPSPSTPSPSSSSPESDAVWITSSTALLKSFTFNDPWHSLHAALSMHQLLQHPSTRILNDSLHFFPFPSDLSRHHHHHHHHHLSRDAIPFHAPNFSYWPLVSATLPKRVDMVRVDTLLSGSQLPKLCYRHGYLDGPWTRLSEPRLVPNLRFGELDFDVAMQYRGRFLQLTQTEYFASNWCPDRSSRLYKPAIGFVFRNSKPRFCNLMKLVDACKPFDLDIRLLDFDFQFMDLFDQVRAMRSIDILVGIHGQELTNMYWAKYGSVLIEVYPHGAPVVDLAVDKYPNSEYGSMALISGSTHIVMGSGVEEPMETWREHDVYVNEKQFSNILTIAMNALKRRRICSTFGLNSFANTNSRAFNFWDGW